MKRGFVLGAIAGLIPSLACAAVVALMAVYDAAEQRRQERDAEDTVGAPRHLRATS